MDEDAHVDVDGDGGQDVGVHHRNDEEDEEVRVVVLLCCCVCLFVCSTNFWTV